MADLPDGVGYLTATARVIEARSDSDDAGDAADAIPTRCKILIEAIGVPATRPYVVASDDDNTIIQLRPITAYVKDGVLYAPTDGATSTDIDDMQPTEGMPLVAPNQSGIDMTGWTWRATLSPMPGETWWKSYSITFGGEPGDIVSLGRSAISAAGAGLTIQPRVWVQSGTAIPAGALTGQYLLDEDTGNLYRIGA